MAIWWSIVRTMLALVAVTLTSGVKASDPAHIPVAIQLSEGDRLIATPIVDTPCGRSATIRLDRPGGNAAIAIDRPGTPASRIELAIDPAAIATSCARG